MYYFNYCLCQIWLTVMTSDMAALPKLITIVLSPIDLPFPDKIPTYWDRMRNGMGYG